MLLIRLPFRGGNWTNGSNAGVFALNLNNPRSNSNTNRGARPAHAEIGRNCVLTGTWSVRGTRGQHPRRKAKKKDPGRELPLMQARPI